MKSAVYVGTTTHKRFLPIVHAFKYPLYMVAFHSDELDQMHRDHVGFSYNQFNCFSLHDADYLEEGEGSIRQKFLALLATFSPGLERDIDSFHLVTTPRYFKKVFNPVSFYYGYDKEGVVKVVVAEVNNTYHEKHVYVLDNPLDESGEAYRYARDKCFYVSPFFTEEGKYEFRFAPLDESINIHITYLKDQAKLFYADLVGVRKPLSRYAWLRLMCCYPLSALLTMPRILFQAALLYAKKKLPARRRPVPTASTTIRSVPLTFLQRQIKRLLLEKALPSVQDGRLTVELFNGEQHVFGDDHGPQVTLRIKDPRFLTQIAKQGGTGLGESYMAGEWEASDLPAFIRLLVRNLKRLTKPDGGSLIQRSLNNIRHAMRRNSLRNSKDNIQAHYDLGNRFYELFLDEHMMYSCAYYQSPSDSLEQAQLNKLDKMIEKAHMKATHRVLEIGSGWGSLAIRIAQKVGCHVTTLTLSQEQFDYVQSKVQALGLSDLVTIKLEDYRLHQGSYDRIVSIEMLEAVGKQYLPIFFRAVDTLLKPNGLAVIQTITIPDQRYRQYSKESDFIKKHIFPGGHLPCVSAIAQILEKETALILEHIENIGPHYARTLAEWRERFMCQLDQVRALGFDDVFIRKWEYYLAYCEAAFIERELGDIQLVLTHPQNRDLVDVDYRQIWSHS